MNSEQKNRPVFNLRSFPWYPVLIALYAPLSLLAHNLGQVEVRDGFRSLLVSLLFSLVLLLFSRIIAGEWDRAGAVSAVLIVLFVSYGHLYTAIKNYEVFGVIVGRHRYLVIIWVALAVLGLRWSLKKPPRIPSLSASLNLAGLVLLIYPTYQVVSYAIASQANPEQVVEAQVVQAKQYGIETTPGQTPPDVYYIILDAYGRSDILQKNVGYDNSAILDELRGLGFYVVDCAQSNYSKTDLSLSSSMNLDYVSNLVDSANPESSDRLPLWKLIKNNEVKAVFESLGYTTVAFDTGYDFTEVESSDIYYSTPQKGFNGFENLYLQTTFAAVGDDFGLLQRMQLTPEDRKRELVLFKLEKLREIPASIPGPKFVFLHLVVPHQPFVFGPDGEPFVIPERVFRGQTYYPPKDYSLGYLNQTVYISQQIPGILEGIIRESAQPPVIILQGDHGPSHYDTPDRMAILNAYYFPGREPGFYPTITPVNSFRMLFNNYFNATFDLLEDVSYYSEYPLAYQFQAIPNTCQAGVR
jgi:hypothetical protein